MSPGEHEGEVKHNYLPSLQRIIPVIETDKDAFTCEQRRRVHCLSARSLPVRMIAVCVAKVVRGFCHASLKPYSFPLLRPSDGIFGGEIKLASRGINVL